MLLFQPKGVNLTLFKPAVLETTIIKNWLICEHIFKVCNSLKTENNFLEFKENPLGAKKKSREILIGFAVDSHKCFAGM